jgi:hypothetical protein
MDKSISSFFTFYTEKAVIRKAQTNPIETNKYTMSFSVNFLFMIFP